ncbi:MAG: OmpP1/FadL family transporter [Phocaeicola sp.]
MKKFTLVSALSLMVSIPTFGGGILTNTNQHAAFLRMVARGASIGVDGVYSNPAGLAFLPNDGFHLSLTTQSAYQTRNIDASYNVPVLTGSSLSTQSINKHYAGTASAPVIPSFQAAYKKGDWTFSAGFAITGGGGKASFDEGLPMFTSLAQSSLGMLGLSPEMYDLKSAMDGKQYIFGLQLGATYKINEWLSVFGGGRMNYVSSGYEGFLHADHTQLGRLVNLQLDCAQTGWGITPIIGANAKVGNFLLAAKYEFRSNLNIENKTKTLEAPEGVDVSAYADGVNTPHDIPAFLSLSVGYSILPTLRATVEYHHFDDKNAGMAGNKQNYLTKGTNEYLAGIEWDATKMFTFSCGYQNTDYGLSDNFQSDTSFYCDSYSIGLGAQVRLTERLKLDVGYFWTNYDNYTKNVADYTGLGEKLPSLNLEGSNIYSRTNKVFGISAEYRF